MYYFVDWFSAAIVPLIMVLIVFGAVKRNCAKKVILMSLLTIYLAIMFDIVGIYDVRFCSWNPDINYIPMSDLIKNGFSLRGAFQYFANIVMFIPLGFLLPVIWKTFRRPRLTIITGAAVTVFIEINQLFLFRLSDIDDLIMNVLGTIVGYIMVSCLAKKTWNINNSDTNVIEKSDIAEFLVLVGLVFISAILIKYQIGEFMYSLTMFA